MIKRELLNIYTYCSAIITTIVYFLGGFDIALQTLILCIVLDYITGVMKAVYNKNLNSQIGTKGLIKKIGYLIIVAFATKIDTLTGNSGAIRTVVIYSFVVNEGISILENWGAMGLPLPKQLFDVLEQISEKKGNVPKDEKTQENQGI